LTGFNGRPGFASVDPDGVYRAYLTDSTIVDAARLTSDQVQTWIHVWAPLLSDVDTAKEREHYTGVDGQDVAEAQLLAPAEELQSKAQLEASAQQMSTRDRGQLVEKRQLDCPSFYCGSNYGLCASYGCNCNSVICMIY
jgi:hypothetical protein